jgi:hypothetical protein
MFQLSTLAIITYGIATQKSKKEKLLLKSVGVKLL